MSSGDENWCQTSKLLTLLEAAAAAAVAAIDWKTYRGSSTVLLAVGRAGAVPLDEGVA
jgi:hypothetical protein